MLVAPAFVRGTQAALRQALEAAGVEFIDENAEVPVCASESPQKISLGNKRDSARGRLRIR